MNAPYIIKLTKNPVPWSETAPIAMALASILAAASASGKASMRLPARGAINSKGYAGKIHIGVIVWTGKVLRSCQRRINVE